MRPVILGMNNPYSTDPYYALYPHPENSAGARICAMFLASASQAGLPLTRRDYIKGFDRRNLVDTPTWNMEYARQRANQARGELQGRKVVICGTAVLGVLGLRRHEWLVWSERSGDLFKDPFDYVLVPHPSGRCREYNDPAVGKAVGDLLLKLYKESQ